VKRAFTNRERLMNHPDLTEKDKSFSKYLQDNLDRLIMMNRDDIKEEIRNASEGLHVSEEYMKKLFLRIYSARRDEDVIQFLYNIVLSGAGLKVI
jgi:hypothetical protein